MKTVELQNMSVGQLVERFIEIGLGQADALSRDNTSKYNQLFRKKTALVAELKEREGDQRRALLDLYEHPNMQVRYNAAVATLALAPQATRAVLEKIRDSKLPDYALHAGMTLFNLDEGVFKPT